MAYLNLRASVTEPEVEALRRDASVLLKPSLLVGVSHLIGLGLPVNSTDFSFLRQCNKPKLFVHGSNDEHGAIAKVKALIPTLPGENQLVVVEGVDHFFAGKLHELNGAITKWLTASVFRLRH